MLRANVLFARITSRLRSFAAGAMADRAIFIMLLVFSLSFIDSAMGAVQSYVVYLGGQHDETLEHRVVADSHHKLLAPVLGSEDAAKDAIFYSYTRVMNGFAANLDEKHALSLSNHPQVLSVFVNRARSMHTTRSWAFLGLESGNGEIPPKSLWKKANFGEDVIIANLDSGVWPESASFSDVGLGPVPSRWKGFCQNGTEFGPAQCNRKLIGARYFSKGYEAGNKNLNPSEADFLSPRDKEGHGTHTLSTAGGNFVKNASIYGYAQGIAKGGAPRARVAAYKVCWAGSGCFDADILAGFDAGIQDGVDVFSVSIGSDPPLTDYFQDAISIGSFHAVQKGKVVVCSAGNSGPTPSTVTNVAPWIITVAASTIDREISANASLGNNGTYIGQSLSENTLPEKKMYPLVSSIDVTAPDANETSGTFCLLGGLDPSKVKGKIVTCIRGMNTRFEKGEAVRLAGGVGMIIYNGPEGGNDISADAHVLPATHLNATDGAAVLAYINSTVSPVAYISPPSTLLHTKPAPVMAAFSSQGPNSLTPDISKPDITAPGSNILAAYSEASSPTGVAIDERRVPFNIESGTSMSCPHVAGIAALLKGAHPDWSPAAIKSAIMTTAKRLDNTKKAIKDSSRERAGPFNYGAGHINPNKAGDPGLVYDLSVEDYYRFFCSLSYDSEQIKAITGKPFICPASLPNTYDLNYPSITVSELIGSVNVQRTLTNVAEGPVTYKAIVRPPKGIFVSVEPKELEFSKIGESKSFTITLRARRDTEGQYVFGSLIWENARYTVVSRIIVNAVHASS